MDRSAETCGKGKEGRYGPAGLGIEGMHRLRYGHVRLELIGSETGGHTFEETAQNIGEIAAKDAESPPDAAA